MTPFSLNINGTLTEYTRPIVMGVLNVTPDSYYAVSRCNGDKDIETRVAEMIAQGAEIIDVGACSTRPGFADVDPEDEMRRLSVALGCIRRVSPDIPVSVDTYHSDVAREAITNMSANIINDISGGNIDERMFETVAQLGVPYILTHSRGVQHQLHDQWQYSDLMADIISELAHKISTLHLLGVNDIIVDPGFGLSKDIEQNYTLLNNLSLLNVLDKPVMVGLSRKSMIARLLGVPTEDTLNGTTVLNTIALSKGASILRVHDVKAACQAIELAYYTYQHHE